MSSLKIQRLAMHEQLKPLTRKTQRSAKNEHHRKYGPFLWIGFKCLIVAEPLQGDSLALTMNCPRALGIHLNNLG